MRPGKILFIKGISQYDAMRNYIDELSHAFFNMGIGTIVLDGTEPSFTDQLIEILHSGSVDVVFTCNGVFMGKEIQRMSRAVFCTWLFDHPIRHMERLQQMKEDTLILTCDRDHMQYIKDYMPTLKNVYFVPLSGSFEANQIPYEERTTSLLFTGSNLQAGATYSKIMTMPDALKNAAKQMIDLLMNHPDMTIHAGLNEFLKQHNLEVTKEQFNQILFDLKDVGLFVRAYYRELVMKQIAQAGVSITIYGKGWEELASHYKNVTLKEGFGKVALQEAVNAKICLNVMPWFKDGFQERIATGMLSNAVVFSDKSKYLLDNFTDGESICIYNLLKVDEIPAKINWLMEHSIKAEQIASMGHDIAIKEHTWKSRAENICGLIDTL